MDITAPPNAALSPMQALAATAETASTRFKKAISTYVLAQAAYTLAKQARNQIRNALVHTVAIDSRDDIYQDVQVALLKNIPQGKRRSLTVTGKRSNSMMVGDSVKTETKIVMYYDGHREQKLLLEGHKIRVTIEKDDNVASQNSPLLRERILFTAHSIEARDAVLRWLQDVVYDANNSEGARFMMSEKWGGWRRREDLEPRTLDTVILRAGQKESLVRDIERFLTMRESYMKFGIPYHRGYLFHGPPGTGKTSLAKALATYFNLDIYYVPLSDLEKDASLLQLVAGVEPGSVLLLEDIDVLHAAKVRDDEDQGVTLSGLLNALDGVSTPSGLITIMTTNFRDVLDDALIRPGRVDRVEKIGYMDDGQLSELVTKFLGIETELPSLRGRKISPAEIMEILKQNLDDPPMALKALIGTLERKKKQKP